MKYIISRIMKMDYKEFFNKVSEISKENNKNKIIVFLILFTVDLNMVLDIWIIIYLIL